MYLLFLFIFIIFNNNTSENQDVSESALILIPLNVHNVCQLFLILELTFLGCTLRASDERFALAAECERVRVLLHHGRHRCGQVYPDHREISLKGKRHVVSLNDTKNTGSVESLINGRRKDPQLSNMTFYI